ncbi:hypothetical protein ABEF95_001291 [Exophiala dermatitidis]
MGSHLTELPDEVIQAVLHYLPPVSTAALQKTCRRFANVTNEPVLWKSYCQREFRWWDNAHDIQARFKDAATTDWKGLYAHRHLAAGATRHGINKIIAEELGRLDVLKEILDEGYDAKDTLFDMFWNASSSANHLAQKYWCHATLGCLHRLVAAEEWAPMDAEPDPRNDQYERPLAALDMFIIDERAEGDIDDVIARLDSYAASVRAAHPDIDDMTPRQKAMAVAGHLLEKKWVGIHDDRNYHSLDHMWLGVALFSSNRNSVPLISAVIYCYVARQFGLRAAPCSYPFHVHALVHPPAGIDLDGNPLPEGYQSGDDNDFHTVGTADYPLTNLYMDPFRSAEPVPLERLQTQLQFISPHSTSDQVASYLSAAPPRSLLTRTAHNILAAPSHYAGDPLHPIDRHRATYAALLSLVMVPATHMSATHVRQHLSVLTSHFLEYFDLDVHLFETYILPRASVLPDARAYRNLLYQLKDADHESRPPKYRSDPRNFVVKYCVGQIFRHRRRGYLAVIYGWDPYCRMQEQWIHMNQVDRLPNGRHQPFYNVLVEDESTRYVAEENIVLLQPHEIQEDNIVDAFPIEIGKWFKRFDAQSGMFVSNVRDEYPED